MEAMMMLSRWQKKSVGEEERNRAESVFAALKRAPRCALERTADQTFRFGKSKHFNLPWTCAIVGDFLFALSCNIAWLSLTVSALWLLGNYFTTRPLRVKHDFVWIVCSEAILQGVRAFVTLLRTICKSHGGLKYLWKPSQIFVAISRFMAALGSPPVELSPLCRKTARPHNWLLYGLFQAP